MVSTRAAVGNMPVVERLMFQQQYIKLWIILVPKWKVISLVCLISPARTLPSSSSAHYCSPSADGGWQRGVLLPKPGQMEGCVLYFPFAQRDITRSTSEAAAQDFELFQVYRWRLPGKKERILLGRGVVLSAAHPAASVSTSACCVLVWDPPK